MIENEAWKLDGKPDKPKIHVKCQPFKAEQVFTFHLDYENLTDNELGVLLTSLCPDKHFHHKLGMGKPLGLGTVRLDIQGVFSINRQKRYARNGFQQARYKTLFSDADSQQMTQYLNDYPLEKQLLEAQTSPPQPANKQSALIDKDSLEILKRIGKYPYSETEQQFTVEYPYVINKEGEKRGGFAWYVKNDKPGGGQALKPVDPEYPLPTLKTYQID